jgi:hypothetical protein
MVEPLRELNEKEPPPSVPVPITGTFGVRLLKFHWVRVVWAEAVEANTLRPIAAIASVRIAMVRMKNFSFVSDSVTIQTSAWNV